MSTPNLTPTEFIGGRYEERSRVQLASLSNRVKDKFSVTLDLPKPQDKFLLKVDNSMEPFVPPLTEKPNTFSHGESDDAFTLRLIVGEDGEEYYPNPYEEEIKAWSPSDKQLSLSSPQVQGVLNLILGEPFNLIDTMEGVLEMLNELKCSTEIAVDLEHHSVRSFMGLTCLIQISTRSRDFIVDGLALHRQLEVLNEVFTDPNIVKVFHGAWNDILWLQRDFGVYVVGLFDTSEAGKYLLNGKLVSLKYLLENFIGIEVDKSYQLADWRLRPLPADMIHYARSDTHYLLSLFDVMKNMLSQDEDGIQQIQGVYENSKSICLQVYKKPREIPSERRLEKMGLSPRSNFAFIELFKWRDTLGRELDESGPDFIISNNLMERLAHSLPTNPIYFREILESRCNDVMSPLIESNMDKLIQIMVKALEIPIVVTSDCDDRENLEGLGNGNRDFESDDDEFRTQDKEVLRKNYYKDMAIVPSIEELFSAKENLLETNVISGAYRSLNHYLNVQFKLLREDFIRSIKPGLREYKESGLVRNYPGIRVHTNIQFLGFGEKGRNKSYHWRLQLPPRLLQISKSTKRFLHGSLLLFTTDNFQNTYYGLISQPRDVQALRDEENGIFTVAIRGEIPKEPWDIGQPFVTIECDAYFEPYRTVLQVLKSNNWLDKIPIGEYILNGSVATTSGQVRLPPYLSGDKKMRIGDVDVDPSNLETWPSPEEVGLDSAQFRAYQAALTQEIVLIQGPPGTGKTYLGLKILETLLVEENRYLWRGERRSGPIIVICYTNHALDQFGEGILDMFAEAADEWNSSNDEEEKQLPVESPRILRLGMGCTSDRLKEYTVEGLGKGNSRMTDMDVILCTTTGAAMRHSSLSKLKSKILIVEEAAEVMESHVIASLTPFVQHLILLGDHQQLRPLTATYELSHKYNLHISLFERLATMNNFPKFQLEVQRRMRPEIRDLITGPHIYPVLKDHEIVKTYPRVKGMKKSLYFLNHRYPEMDQNLTEDSMSKSNPFEAHFLACLTMYLLSQGYEEEDITILAMYSSQVRLLEMEIWYKRGISRKLRIETVDSFQGEENTIILLSLVRSNTNNSIGFMRTDNRICVALSRAKHGFYMIGNMRLLAQNSTTWAAIGDKLLSGGNIGPKLTLTCDTHENSISAVVGTIQHFENFFRTPTPCSMCVYEGHNRMMMTC